MCMYVCMFVCVHVCMYTCTHMIDRQTDRQFDRWSAFCCLAVCMHAYIRSYIPPNKAHDLCKPYRDRERERERERETLLGNNVHSEACRSRAYAYADFYFLWFVVCSAARLDACWSLVCVWYYILVVTCTQVDTCWLISCVHDITYSHMLYNSNKCGKKTLFYIFARCILHWLSHVVACMRA